MIIIFTHCIHVKVYYSVMYQIIMCLCVCIVSVDAVCACSTCGNAHTEQLALIS